MRNFSKSELLAYDQCQKRLWLQVNKPQLVSDAATPQSTYVADNRLKAIAREIFDTNGRGKTFDVKAKVFKKVLAQTQRAIKKTGRNLSRRRSLFEAGFEAEGAHVLVDALLPVRGPDDIPPRWEIVEVKAASSVKDAYLEDAAIQYFVATNAGLALNNIAIAHIDSDWVYDVNGCYDGLLIQVDVTQEIQDLVLFLPLWIKRAQAVLDMPVAPVISTGERCNTPYPCGFLAFCQSAEPAISHPVKWLPRVQTTALRAHLAKPKVKSMQDVPDELLNAQQLRVKQATLNGCTWRDAKGAAKSLAAYPVPCYFLDFETIGDVVPRWIGTRAFQPIPFQFSLHRIGPRGGLTHTAFLDTTGKDPRLAFAQALVQACGTSGAVFAYNSRFEAGCIEDLIEYFASRRKLAKALLNIYTRLVDLEPIVRQHYYHPSQQGSWSLKAVLPALIPHLSYEALDGVKSGMDAQVAYAEAAKPVTSKQRANLLQRQLLAYCKLDTLALVEIWREFRKPKARRIFPKTII